ncbi:MAG: hypothetical protein M1826_006875 [Phylliscum demangeonii]|nr:MAG: hypothetical protein M1826_006875 [Phylliscum demangeonii]
MHPRNEFVAASFAWLHAAKARLGYSEDAQFLEQFRYVIVASQLLDVDSSRFKPAETTRFAASDAGLVSRASEASFSLARTLEAAVAAFLVAWLLAWTRGGGLHRVQASRIVVALAVAIPVATAYHYYRQWRSRVALHQQALQSATKMVAQAQEFDVTAAMAISIIQDVELVSRGYQLGAPLPPISRIEERSHSRRCFKLRRNLRSALVQILPLVEEADHKLRPWANVGNLEKYFNIYDLDEMAIRSLHSSGQPSFGEDEESIKSLKASLHRFHNLRKLLLCVLLALPALNDHGDRERWALATASMSAVGGMLGECTANLRTTLLEEEPQTQTASPPPASKPANHPVRMQLRRLGSLSQGIRGIQAKMHILREESEKSMEAASVDVAERGASLLAHYDSIGADLHLLLHEWATSRAALVSQVDKTEARLSRIAELPASRSSRTTSLGGRTAIAGGEEDNDGGGPAEALRALDGRDTRKITDVSRSVDLEEADEEEEEVFEAVAAPRQQLQQRSPATREERIARMKEERARAGAARDRAQANTHMLRELESVISLKAQGARPGARVVAL